MSRPKRYWMMKSEPDAFSIDDLERVGTEPWLSLIHISEPTRPY